MATIILDVDGTLWDSTEQVARAWNKVIQEYLQEPAPLTGKMLKGLFGKPIEEIFETLFPNLSREEREELEKRCTKEEHVYMNVAPCYVFDGVLEGVATLSKTHDLYIVSNCMSGYIEAFLHNTQLAPYIQDHLCYGDTGRPKGDNIRQIMQKHGLTNAVYVGDTLGDYMASKKACVPFVYAAYGFGDVKDSPCAIDSFSQLLTLDFQTLQAEYRHKNTCCEEKTTG